MGEQSLLVMVTVLLIAIVCTTGLTNTIVHKTTCETNGPVEEGKRAILNFFLSTDPTNISYVNVFRDNQKTKGKGFNKVSVLELNYDNSSGGLMPTFVAPGYEYAGIVGNILILVMKNTMRDMNGTYCVEDTHSPKPSQREACNLTVKVGSALDNVEARVNSTEARLKELEDRVHSVERRHDSDMNLIQRSQGSALDNVEARVNSTEARLKELEDRVHSVERRHDSDMNLIQRSQDNWNIPIVFIGILTLVVVVILSPTTWQLISRFRKMWNCAVKDEQPGDQLLEERAMNIHPREEQDIAIVQHPREEQDIAIVH